MISFKHKGNFKKVNSFFERLKELMKTGVLDKYGRIGVQALASATPKDSGKTAESWHYIIERNGGGARLQWLNSNINQNVNIAIILQYGHGTGTGGYVQGRDYINPAIQPIFDQIAEELWKEVTRK